ncbi:MAG: hypothetical protein HYV19_09795 [Gemmatimonadetes bacterium]|nr:hypothetical protein [Gemmatimonadota bacterium]
MDHEIVVSPDRSHIVLRIIGPTGRNRMGQVFEAHRLGVQLNIRCFLVDLRRAVNLESPEDDHAMAHVDFPNTPLVDRTARVCCVVSPDDHSHDLLLAAFRESGSNIERFESIEEAEAYLRAGR